MQTLAITTPQPNEVEVTLFGPGYGECLTIHADREWLIVDSCQHPDTKCPVAIEYLEGIGVDLSCVSKVICTHWHDDHAKGLAEAYKACPSAELIISSALKRDEFLQVIESYERWPSEGDVVSSGVDEMRRALSEVQARGMHPRFAGQDQRLWRSQSGIAELFSLTPSAGMIAKAFRDIALLIPSSARRKRRAYVRSPNHIAMALHLRIGDAAILLGSDLEEENDPTTGWSSVLASTTRPTERASLYKVAHHGSRTGEHNGIWSTLLQTSPISILTPFSKLRDPLPTEADQARLKTNSRIAMLTARHRKRAYRRHGAVAKLTKSKDLKRVETGFGAVRCRANTLQFPLTWNLELQGDAHAL